MFILKFDKNKKLYWIIA